MTPPLQLGPSAAAGMVAAPRIVRPRPAAMMEDLQVISSSPFFERRGRFSAESLNRQRPRHAPRSARSGAARCVRICERPLNGLARDVAHDEDEPRAAVGRRPGVEPIGGWKTCCTPCTTSGAPAPRRYGRCLEAQQVLAPQRGDVVEPAHEGFALDRLVDRQAVGRTPASCAWMAVMPA